MKKPFPIYGTYGDESYVEFNEFGLKLIYKVQPLFKQDITSEYNEYRLVVNNFEVTEDFIADQIKYSNLTIGNFKKDFESIKLEFLNWVDKTFER